MLISISYCTHSFYPYGYSLSLTLCHTCFFEAYRLHPAISQIKTFRLAYRKIGWKMCKTLQTLFKNASNIFIFTSVDPRCVEPPGLEFPVVSNSNLGVLSIQIKHKIPLMIRTVHIKKKYVHTPTLSKLSTFSCMYYLHGSTRVQKQYSITWMLE